MSEELEQLALSADGRMRAALGTGDGAAALEAHERIETMWRTFVGILDDWIGLTEQYLSERHGRAAAAASAARIERRTELALRRGLGLAQTQLSATMLEGPDHRLRRELSTALARGELDAAELAWREAARTMADARALRIDVLGDLLGAIAERHGDECMEEAMLYAAERGFWREAFPAQVRTPPLELLGDTAFFLTAGAGCELRLSEESDRYVIEFLDCHCGRQVREHATHGWDLAVIRGPRPLTYGVPEMTPYQCHFAVIHGCYAIDTVGAPTPPFDCLGTAVGLNGGCRNYIYKEPGSTPSRFYEALGRSA